MIWCTARESALLSPIPFLLCLGLLWTLLGATFQFKQIDSKYSIRHCDVDDQFPETIRINEMNSREINQWQLRRSHNYSLKADFKAKSAAQRVYLNLLLQIGNQTIRLPFFRKNLCQTQSGLQCPLAVNGTYSFKLNVQIPQYTPNVEGSLRMQLVNEKKRKLLCFIMPLTVYN